MATDKQLFLRTFNTHLFELLDDVIRILPDNLDIQTAKTSFWAIKKANPTIIIKAWYSYIYVPYNETIVKADLEFFLQKDYTSDLANVSNSSDVIKIVNSLKDPLSKLNEREKQIILEYFQNLNKLSALYAS
jgi:hypothetical protein